MMHHLSVMFWIGVLCLSVWAIWYTFEGEEA